LRMDDFLQVKISNRRCSDFSARCSDSQDGIRPVSRQVAL
jgi:hypothetical protein